MQISHNISAIIFLLILFFVSEGVQSGDSRTTILDRAVIALFMDEFDRVIEEKDVHGLITMMAEDAHIMFTRNENADMQNIEMNREEFEEFLRVGFQAISNFQYRRTDTDIRINDDNSEATVAFNVAESFSAHATKVQTRTRETIILSTRSGQPRISSLVVKRIEKTSTPLIEPH